MLAEDLYGIKISEPPPLLPPSKYFLKNTKTRIPQLTPDFFKNYSEQLYISYINEMLNIGDSKVCK